MSGNSRFAMAVHACAVLAMAPGGIATSDRIAGSINTNPVVVRRILSALGKAGLVANRRGAAGGASLARPPEAISILDILRAVGEAPVPALHPHPPNPACPVGAGILPVLSDLITRAERAWEREMASVSLADIVAALDTRTAPSS